MTKFLVTPDRLREAVGYVEFINLLSGKDLVIAARVAPRFVVEGGEYAVRVELDEDDNIKKLVGYEDVFTSIASLPAGRLKQIADDLHNAARAVIELPAPSQKASVVEAV